ncbi:hypothetical protein VTO42DRAFT_8755 [Malbranchea cinnamomea]
MYFVAKASVLALAAVATLSEASPHVRLHNHRRWWPFWKDEDADRRTVTVRPIPASTPSFPTFPSISLSTGFSYPGPAPTGIPSGPPEPDTVSSQTVTLTYTLGTGTSTTVVTTTVCLPISSELPVAPTETAADLWESSSEEQTTTISSTSTTTKYVTVTLSPIHVKPEHSGFSEVSEASCVPVTVTETETKTVTVTAKPLQPTDGDEGDNDNDETPSSASASSTTAAPEEHGPGHFPRPIFSVLPTSPYGNGTTTPFPTGRSGFLTVPRPSPTHDFNF